MSDGWTRAGSPFHPGEQAVQARLGVRDEIEAFAKRVVRDHLPEQHRAFHGELPFVVLGTVDDSHTGKARLNDATSGLHICRSIHNEQVNLLRSTSIRFM